MTTKKTETYNGWSNYETWLVSLWLDNDQETYNKIRNIIKRNGNISTYAVSKKIQDFVEKMVFTDKASLQQDLINSAIQEVNFPEIVQSMIDE